MSAPDSAGPVLPAARVALRQGQPYSLDFEDIYHAADGDAEVARVFLGPTALDDVAAERARRSGPAAVVRIGELGFGSGLNFVLAAERCLAAGARLHFVTVEAAPIDAAAFAAVAAARAGAHPLYRALADAYPPRVRGWHRRWLADGRICLSLWLGDAEAGLTDLMGRQLQPMDAWFLDGFAPDRNPAMWEPDLMRRVAALSRPGTRVATFTAAGRVRRALTDAGFAMTRVDQRPHKRESLAGTLMAGGLDGFDPPATVQVAGAGLAGASIAWHLARAGHAVQVWDPGAAGDAERPGSTMPVTVLHGRLLADATPAADARCHGYLYAADLLRGLDGFHPSGVLQRPARAVDRLPAIADRYANSGAWLQRLDRAEATALAGWPVEDGCLFMPGAGRVDLPTLVAGLLSHPNIEVVPESLTDGADAACRVLACGAAMHTFEAARYLELAPVAGQIDLVTLERPPTLPLVGRGYLVPAGDVVAAGATYEYRPWPPERATAANLAQLEGHDYVWRSRRRGTRTVSSDRMAVAGRLYDADGQPVAGHYASAGHGSAGNVSAHFAAAVLTALIGGDSPPLTQSAEAALSPLRFRLRQARRGPRHGAAELPTTRA